MRRCLLLALALALATTVRAADEVVPTSAVAGITLQKWRNVSSVAIQAIVQGDDDSSAVLRIFQGWNDLPTVLDTGMVMVRRTGSSLYEGRILWMTPGRTARYYVEANDGGVKQTTPPDTASCTGVPALVATGAIRYANQATGDDANDCTAPFPCRTISRALLALKALAGGLSGGGANGGVVVAPGEYHERIDLNFGGLDGAPRFLIGDGTNRDSTIICGANEIVEAGKYNASNNLAWVKIDPSDGPDSVYVTPFPAATGPADSTELVVVGWGETLHRKTSLKALFADSTYIGTGTSSVNSGEASGWFWSGDSLYVKRRNGQSPAGITLHTGYRDDLIKVTRRLWRIANLTLRYAGGRAQDQVYLADAQPFMLGVGIRLGSSANGSLTVIDSVRVYGCASATLQVDRGAGSIAADSLTIADSIFDGLTIGAWAYGASKSRAEETASEVFLRSNASSFYRNTIQNTFNGIGFDAAAATDSLTAAHCEISGNTIQHMPDDAIEFDGAHQIGTLCAQNLIVDTGSAFSIAPIYTGPLWILYNVAANQRFRGFKTNGTVGLVRAYHNTLADLRQHAFEAPGPALDGQEYLNNIFGSSEQAYGIVGPSSGGSTGTNAFNWNLYPAAKIGTAAFIWNNSNVTFASLPGTLGWEANGLNASPAYLDSTRLLFQLKSTSPGYRAGRRITGVNTGLDGNRYVVAPSMGAKGVICERPQ